MGNLRLTNADSGSAVSVSSGDTITLELEENPTTGYQWIVEELDSRVLELTGESYDAANAIGGGGKRMLTFTANGAGVSPLRLKCVRQWEPDTPLNTFSVTIDVHA